MGNESARLQTAKDQVMQIVESLVNVRLVFPNAEDELVALVADESVDNGARTLIRLLLALGIQSIAVQSLTMTSEQEAKEQIAIAMRDIARSTAGTFLQAIGDA